MEQRKALFRVLMRRDRRDREYRSQSDTVYDAIEDVWLDAVQAYQEVNGTRFLKHTDYLWIAFRLGMGKFDVTTEGMIKRLRETQHR